jgi:V/A-type H+-transporting ATPase subunit F
MKLLVIGHPEAVLGFSLVGVDGRPASTPAEANQALDVALADSELGIILVTEDVTAMIEARMDDLRAHSTVPLVVEIPSPEGRKPGQPTLNDIVLRAIGIKI